MNQAKQFSTELAAVIPAAGVGKRMQAGIPKQYLKINQQSILEHTINKLSAITAIKQIILVVSDSDPFIATLKPNLPPHVQIVEGGNERVNSVLAGLKSIDRERFSWCLVHDAARPCVLVEDIENLIKQCLSTNQGGILATPVRDTMKRQKFFANGGQTVIDSTENREGLWHALTPQMFPVQSLVEAIEAGLTNQLEITDEASAIEPTGAHIHLVEADASNIKITRASDLALAEFFLNREHNED